MYLYLYAPFLRNKKYARELALIEGRVTDFGISGKISQLSQFLKFPAAVKEFGLKRLKTLVLVGDDALLEEAVNAFAKTSVILGYIPAVKSNYAPELAIPDGLAAVDALAARRIIKLDLGRIGEKYFLGKVCGEGKGLDVHTPTFSIFPKGFTRVEIVNLGDGENGNDGLLTVRVTPFKRTWWSREPEETTVLKIASCRLKAVRPISVNCGASGVVKTPIQVDIIPEAIRMIGGRRTARRVSSK
ncbi:hypothetical protein HYW17_01865 [Candidatus Uhrbacteria bacterium]|nr:hypothetical protein [Candidatus Uhrbacteria bacterium]